MPNSTDLGIINERVTAALKFRLVNEAGAGMGPADLTTLLLTLYEEESGTIINSVTDVDIKNVGRGALDASGNLTITLTPDDNQVITTKGREVHVALIEWTYPTAKAGRHEARFTVLNLAKVP